MTVTSGALNASDLKFAVRHMEEWLENCLHLKSFHREPSAARWTIQNLLSSALEKGSFHSDLQQSAEDYELVSSTLQPFCLEGTLEEIEGKMREMLSFLQSFEGKERLFQAEDIPRVELTLNFLRGLSARMRHIEKG